MSEPALERLGDLLYLPGADLPFGKVIQMGLQETTIYQRVIEQGYRAGIRAHARHLETAGEIEALSDQQFIALMDHLLPRELSPGDQETWRSYFIVGWTGVFLGVVLLEYGEGDESPV